MWWDASWSSTNTERCRNLDHSHVYMAVARRVVARTRRASVELITIFARCTVGQEESIKAAGALGSLMPVHRNVGRCNREMIPAFRIPLQPLQARAYLCRAPVAQRAVLV
jgi:hypothetical protein